mmetsp:Transcript_41453/g.86964  ORF Transcript_41453/g.86964 Transcript_41453/m.86964 type:complete len:562 (-) Transcript_41453:52-1737(-)
MTMLRNILTATTTASAFVAVTTALSLQPHPHHGRHHHHHHHHHQVRSPSSSPSFSTALHLGDLDDVNDMSDYGRQNQKSELDSLTSKRDQIRMAKLANIKPDDDTPKMEEMSDEEIQAMLLNKNKGSSDGGDEDNGGGNDDGLGMNLDVDQLFSRDYVPDFKTKRAGSSNRGLSGGDSGGVLDGDPNDEEDGEVDRNVFVDWTEDYDDENEFHVPNRIGFSTCDWGNARKGFVAGKLKKKERRAGKFNKADLRKAYEKLQQNGVSFVETSESSPLAEAFLNKFMEECDHGDNSDKGALVASTFPNPWKQALKSRSLPRRGAASIVSAAETACDRMGISSMGLYQIENPWYYVGGTSALAEGALDVICDDHSRYVGCVNMGLTRLAKLQRKMRAQGEFVASNQFEFSLTNRKNAGMIDACKKLGITPVCTNVLDGGLATGKYTSTNPTGGEVSKGENDTGPYAVRKLEKLDALFKVQAGLIEKVNRRIGDRLMKFESGQAPRINRDITTTQIAINYVRAKGAVPLVSVTNVKMANELLGCLGWDLSEEEVEELDKACKASGV